MSLLWLTNWRRVESRAVFCLSRILNLANISLREYLPWSGFASTIYMHVLLFRSLIGMDEERRNVKEDQRLIRVSMKVILGLGSHRSRGSLVTGKYSSPIVRWNTWYLFLYLPIGCNTWCYFLAKYSSPSWHKVLDMVLGCSTWYFFFSKCFSTFAGWSVWYLLPG